MYSLSKAKWIPQTQIGVGLALGLSIGLLYAAYENWSRAGILFVALGLGVAALLVLRQPLAAFLGFSFALTSDIHSLVPAVSAMGFLLASFAGIILEKLVNWDYTWRFPLVNVTALLFTLWFYAGLIWSPELLPITNHYLYGAAFALLIMIVAAESIRTPQQWRWLMIAFALGIVVTAISSVVGVFTFLNTEIDLTDVNAAKKLDVARYFGHWGGPNALGHTLAPFTPLLVPYLNRSETMWMRMLAGFALFCGILAVAMSLSRAAILALGFALCIVFAVSQYRKLLFMSGVIAIFVAVAVLPVNLLGRLDKIAKGRSSDASLNERSFIAKGALGIAEDYFPIGTGIAGFNYYYQDYLERTAIVYHAHNAYLQVLAETGLPGVLLYLSTIGASIWGVIRSLPNVLKHSVAAELRIALLATILSIMLAAVFENNVGWLAHWYLFALAGIYPHVFGEPALSQR